MSGSGLGGGRSRELGARSLELGDAAPLGVNQPAVSEAEQANCLRDRAGDRKGDHKGDRARLSAWKSQKLIALKAELEVSEPVSRSVSRSASRSVGQSVILKTYLEESKYGRMYCK